MVQSETTISVTNPLYDEVMFKPLFLEFYEQSGFGNYGYWEAGITNARQACENLVAKLLDRLPHKTGKILDVACGKGETTRCLLAHYPPEAITAINISDRQLEAGRERVPGATFLKMNATQLEFADETFTNIICVEAAFHFDTRREFLAEAYRVLQPGGAIALSDILMPIEAERARLYRTEANFLPGPDDYVDMLKSLGYRNIRIDDVTEQCWRGFFRYLSKFLHEKYLRREISLETLKQHMETNYRLVPDLENYLLVSAEK